MLSVAAAADELGVSRARVRALIAAGTLQAMKVADAYVVEEKAVDALAARSRPAHVRSFSRRIAWACAALVDGQHPTGLRADELSRLRARLDRSDGDPGAWQNRLVARAAHSARYRAGPAAVQNLLADGRAVRTGVSATNLVGDPILSAPGADVWVSSDLDQRRLRADHGLLPSTSGNVTIRVAEIDGLRVLGCADGNAFRLMVAADLLDAPDTRTRYAGAELLGTAISERRWRSAA